MRRRRGWRRKRRGEWEWKGPPNVQRRKWVVDPNHKRKEMRQEASKGLSRRKTERSKHKINLKNIQKAQNMERKAN